MFADSDFILVLVKESDWLKERAEKILEENKGKIKTSISVMIEMALLSKRFDRSVLETFTDIFEFVNVDEDTYTVCMRAANYIEENGLNVFDAFHASFAFKDVIISSDSAFDKIGVERLKLEETESIKKGENTQESKEGE